MATCNGIQARVGREKQRYEDKFRLVAGCIPYRLKNDVKERCNGALYDELEVLMISTPNRQDLVFPKGGWENDEAVHEAAIREAVEEAGVRGNINKKELGVWEFRSKSKQNSCSQEGGCRGYMFALEVTEELESWPEKDTHHRRWVGVSEARELCRYDWMQEALDAFLQRLRPAVKQTLAVLPAISESLRSVCAPKASRIERTDNAIILHVDNGLLKLVEYLRKERKHERGDTTAIAMSTVTLFF
ncbi:uncharacterized protein A4U43_C04F16100 [Asparagus officinalis]|uniref:Nudix hydrolase domain-containing protein n=1 Tax=Asparagus officinalis TaxID=4686 RepID=A0A5P1F318_ASPOF|nr:nudix hydrolase 13, mitochondrial-like [Asparagus officinalis]XP_020259493.1 nudix hydrolase 13, mitochondrial-like [Asparagus officinalis]ONK72133.1 uncharacterized protein A4U43_C04F16100 [Asparagus officinalis]